MLRKRGSMLRHDRPPLQSKPASNPALTSARHGPGAAAFSARTRSRSTSMSKRKAAMRPNAGAPPPRCSWLEAVDVGVVRQLVYLIQRLLQHGV